MKKIMTVFALLSLLSCKKEEPVVAKETTTTTATSYEPKTFYFSQDYKWSIKGKIGLASEPMPPLMWQLYSCSDMDATFNDGDEYRVQFYSNDVQGYPTVLDFEAVVTYENGELTVNKTAGNYNMFYSDDCGMFKHLVK